jgi:UDP-N-acetylmuramate--alanine ligase
MDNVGMKKDDRIHLIGIGGSGLSAIALVLLESGFSVSGSDQAYSPFLIGLQEKGARLYTGHDPRNVEGAGLVVRSSAVPDDNLEVKAALQAGIPVLKRAVFLERLMHGKLGIAVAGTHGKTTSTAMISWTLLQLGQDPTFIAGSKLKGLDTNARAGNGPVFVIEADEYDGMFLGLHPQIAVVTNMEYDHPDCYPSPEHYRQAFMSFTSQIQPGGVLLFCGEDAGASELAGQVEERTCLSYGLASASFDYQARNISINEAGGFNFDYKTRQAPGPVDSVVRVSLQVTGEHNVRNALAALAVADQLGLSPTGAAQALGTFKGTGRRFEIAGEVGGVTVINDYAHHPTEVRATLSAARARYSDRRLWVVWQPHTYSRTRSLLNDFSAAFRDADRVIVTAIYPAREAPPEDGFSARQVMNTFQHPAARHVPDLSEVTRLLLEELAAGDVLLVLSAGDADRVSAEVVQALKERI